MKKAVVYSILGILAILSSSCHRDYTCHCYITTKSIRQEATYYIGKTTESDALKACTNSNPSTNDSCYVTSEVNHL
jgi:hypothetical protein